MIEIRPDPGHRRGGYALFRLDAEALDADEVSITLRNSFNEKYLGEQGWQAGKVYFGPYPVRREGDAAEFVVGTEIVNQVEEYTPLVVGIGTREFETAWPDDIAHGPAAATLGGVSATPPKAATAPTPNLVGKAAAADAGAEAEGPPSPEPQPSAAEPPPDLRAAPVADEEPNRAAGGGGRGMALVALVLLVALAGAGAFYLLNRPGAPSPTPPAIAAEEPPAEAVAAAEPETEPCADGALASLADEDHRMLVERLGTCVGSVSVDAALGLIETGVDRDDPVALATMGRLYDEAEVIEGVETAMGLSFADNPARAAEYYARALAADTASDADPGGALAALEAVCARLDQLADTLSRGAYDQYCAE